MKPRRFRSSKIGTSLSTGCLGGSRRSSELGNEATACAACDGAGSLKPPAKSTSPPSPATSNEPSISCSQLDEGHADGKAMPPSQAPDIDTPQFGENGAKLGPKPIRAQVSLCPDRTLRKPAVQQHGRVIRAKLEASNVSMAAKSNARAVMIRLPSCLHENQTVDVRRTRSGVIPTLETRVTCSDDFVGVRLPDEGLWIAGIVCSDEAIDGGRRSTSERKTPLLIRRIDTSIMVTLISIGCYRRNRALAFQEIV